MLDYHLNAMHLHIKYASRQLAVVTLKSLNEYETQKSFYGTRLPFLFLFFFFFFSQHDFVVGCLAVSILFGTWS
jgi:hypothetical protein